MSNTTKSICINGMGIALFVAFSMCLRVPVFENYYLCLGYIVMAVYCYTIGPISGTLVGTLGTILYCLLINGLRGMPGWALGNIVIGIILGLWFKLLLTIQTHRKNWFVTNILTSIIIVIATAIGILGLKSIIEMFLYAQPFVLRIANNSYAFVADVVVLILSLPICKILNPHLKKFIAYDNKKYNGNC